MSKTRLAGMMALAATWAFAACSALAPPTADHIVTNPRPEQDAQAPAPDPTTADRPEDAGGPTEYDIVTLLPRDAIPAIFDPAFLSAAEADAQYAPDELVIGVAFDGDARAYSIPYLSSHEIVNDTVAGRPIAVTW